MPSPLHLRDNPDTGGSDRTTSSIIWNCLSVLFLCSYTVYHASIQQPKLPPLPNANGRPILTHLSILAAAALRSTATTILGCVMPEMITLYALEQVIAAQSALLQCGVNVNPLMRLLIGDSTVVKMEWTGADEFIREILDLQVAFYATAGGIWIPIEHVEAAALDVDGPLDRQARLEFAAPFPEVRDPNGKKTRSFRSITLVEYAKFIKECPPKLQERYLITPGHIEAVSKGDPMTKLVTFSQAVIFSITLIARYIEGLPSTLLELGTAAYSVSAACIYVAWWKKPYNFSYPTILWDYEEVVSSSSTTSPMQLLGSQATTLQSGHTDRTVLGQDMEKKSPPQTRAMSVSYPDTEQSRPILALKDELSIWKLAIYFTGLIFYFLTLCSFGVVHLFGWNWHFPSPTAKTIWRVSSIITTAYFPTQIIILVISMHYQSWGFVAALWGGLNVAVKLLIFAVGFWSFKQPPPGVYQDVDWVAFLPSIS